MNVAVSRKARIALLFDEVNKVIDQVSLSPSSVRTENSPIGVSVPSYPARPLMSREISRKIDEIAVFGFLDRAAATRDDDPVAGRASSSHGVDDQIAGICSPDVVRTPTTCGTPAMADAPVINSRTLSSSTDGYVRCGLRHRSYRPFDDRPPTGDATHRLHRRDAAPCPIWLGEEIDCRDYPPKRTRRQAGHRSAQAIRDR